MQEKIVSPEKLKDLVKRIFAGSGLASEAAAIEADVLCWANLHGVDSHGVVMVPWYLENLKKGVMNPKPNIAIEKETGSTLLIEADRALGPVVTVFAMKKAIQKAVDSGICVSFIRNVTHQGAIGYYSLLAAKSDMAGIIFTCNPPNMAPWGARAVGVHNSPISIAVPGEVRDPILLDMATSVVAGGKINLALEKQTSIPEGWALDKFGKPTTDPIKAAILLPAGGAKGSGLALMLECLSSILMGNPLLEPNIEIPDEANMDSSGEKIKRPVFMNKHIQNSVVMAINIGQFTNIAEYKTNIDNLISKIKALPKADGFSEIFVPGEPESATASKRMREGIPLPLKTIENLKLAAEELNVEFPF